MRGAVSVLVRGTVKSLKWRMVFTKDQYSACCSSSLCLKPYHESSALGSPGRTSMPMTLLSSLNRLRNVSGGSWLGKKQWRRKDRVNAGKTKIMICGKGLDLLQSSGEFPCSVCPTGVGSNSIFCNGCKHWVYKKCSRLKRLKKDPDYRCTRHLSFKTRGRVYSSCVRSAMLHASETWPLTKPNLQRLQRNDRAMIRQICNVRPQDTVTTRSSELLVWLGIEDLDLILKERRLQWYGHVERSNGAVKTAFDIQVDEKRGPGRPKMTWKQLTVRDCREWKFSAINPYDRRTWRSGVRSAMRAASQLSGRGPTDVDVAPVPAC